MKYSKAELWARFQKYYAEFPTIGLALDLSRVVFPDGYLDFMEERMKKAFGAMAALEHGAIANPDENRMVGHYWLRNPALSPTPEIRKEIEDTIVSIEAFAADIHSGKIRGKNGIFKNLLVIGIGGSALGPQFVASALGQPKADKMKVFFFDNTDPDGMDRVLDQLEGDLGQTLVVVISKSGGTKETRNGMIEAALAYQRNGLDFGKHAVAITGKESALDKFALNNDWINRFPMWDWVGGRTSELSAVGLLPAALQGIDIQSFINGASACDEITRTPSIETNPSAQLAIAWYFLGNGKGCKNMVILPYKDRLDLFSKYLQQLIMESLGKEFDLNENIVNQGLAVFGNKGSTDQHSYIQQLREGLNNFFATFIQVVKDRENESPFIEPNTTTGDYLNGFLMGTRESLFANNRHSITVSIDCVSAFSIGVLIALFERAVGFYANLIEVNAYHQPGVEAGKRAAELIIALQHRIIQILSSKKGDYLTALEISNEIGVDCDVESVFKICQHLAGNKARSIKLRRGTSPTNAAFCHI